MWRATRRGRWWELDEVEGEARAAVAAVSQGFEHLSQTFVTVEYVRRILIRHEEVDETVTVEVAPSSSGGPVPTCVDAGRHGNVGEGAVAWW